MSEEPIYATFNVMRILTNEYLSNALPDTGIAHGGPAHFARAFSSYLIGSSDNVWIGLTQDRRRARKKRFIRQISCDSQKRYYGFSPSGDRTDVFIKEQAGKVDPGQWFAEELDQLRRFIRKTRPDVLFLNGFSLYAWLLLRAAKDEDLPIVIQHAGIAKKEFDQYKHLYTPAFRKAMLGMEKDIARYVDKQIFLNEYSYSVFNAIVARVPETKKAIIPLPYPALFAQAFPTAQRKKVSKTVRIGCVARWDRIKNHEALLALAKVLRDKYPEWEMVCVTRIPDSVKYAEFKQAYRSHIRVVDPMPSKKLRAFYRSVDILVLPSHFDVSPGVVMEAALCGVGTLISPFVGWVSSYAAAGLDDWVVDFSHPREVVKKLESFIKKPAPAAFRRGFLRDHCPDRVFAQYEEVFASAILGHYS